PVLERAKSLTDDGYEIHCEQLANYPALNTEAGNTFLAHVMSSAAQPATDAVSFGSEAGLFQKAGIPSVVCGPGDIGRAHKANEYIARRELAACDRFLQSLIRSF